MIVTQSMVNKVNKSHAASIQSLSKEKETLYETCISGRLSMGQSNQYGRMALVLSPAIIPAFLETQRSDDQEAIVSLVSTQIVALTSSLPFTMSVALYGANEIIPSKSALDTIIANKFVTDKEIITELVGKSALEAKTKIVSFKSGIVGQIHPESSSSQQNGVRLLPVLPQGVGILTDSFLPLSNLASTSTESSSSLDTYAVAGILVLEGIFPADVNWTIRVGVSLVLNETSDLDKIGIDSITTPGGIFCAPSLYAFGPTVYEQWLEKYDYGVYVNITKTTLVVSAENRGKGPILLKTRLVTAKENEGFTTQEALPNELYPGTDLSTGFGIVNNVSLDWMNTSIWHKTHSSLSVETTYEEILPGKTTMIEFVLTESNSFFFMGKNEDASNDQPPNVSQVNAQPNIPVSVLFNEDVPWTPNGNGFGISVPCVLLVSAETKTDSDPQDLSCMLQWRIRQEITQT